MSKLSHRRSYPERFRRDAVALVRSPPPSAFDAPRSRVRRPRDAAREQTRGLPRVRRADEMDSLGSRNPRDADCGDNLLNGDEMKTEAQSHNRDGEATTGHFPLAPLVVAELLCTGALVAWVVLWM